MKKEDVIELIASWENLDLFSRHMVDHPGDLDLLMQVALDESRQEYWRAAWVADKINTVHPELIRPYLPSLFKALKETGNYSKMRHFLKIITFHQIPARQRSFLFDYCLNIFSNQSIPVAVRAHALQILYHIAQDEPGLKPELIQILEHELSFQESAGIRAKAKNILMLLYRKPSKEQIRSNPPKTGRNTAEPA